MARCFTLWPDSHTLFPKPLHLIPSAPFPTSYDESQNHHGFCSLNPSLGSRPQRLHFSPRVISAGGFGTCLIPRVDSTQSLALTICVWSLPTNSGTEPANSLPDLTICWLLSDLLVQAKTTKCKPIYPCSATIPTALPFCTHALRKATSWPLHFHKGHTKKQYYWENLKKKYVSLRPKLYSILLSFWGF